MDLEEAYEEAPEGSDQDLIDFHSAVRAEFDKVQDASKPIRDMCLSDREFYSVPGAQWDNDWGTQFENKPKIEINKVHLSVMKVITQYRNNRISVNFYDRTGDTESELSDVCDDLFRADEEDSTADEAYDNAFEEAVGGGIGAWRLVNEYEDESDLDEETQRIRFEPIFDADKTVFFNLDAKRQDKSDATKCWVLTPLSYDEYVEQWDDDPASWPKDEQETLFDWYDEASNVVWLAEYYEIVNEDIDYTFFKAPMSTELERVKSDDSDTIKDLLVKGYTKERTRTIKSRRVRKYIMSGSKILKDCGYIAGSEIPVVIVFGKRWYVNNQEYAQGQTRLGRDPQIVYNVQISQLTTISSMSPIEKPILFPEQIAGHQQMWSRDNIDNYNYMLVNPIVDEGGNPINSTQINYTKPPTIPPALSELMRITNDDVKEVLGNSRDGQDMMGTNIAFDTANLIQMTLDEQTQIYMSNMAKAMRRCGQIWLSMARDTYVEIGRKMRGVNLQGGVRQIILNRAFVKEGATTIQNDLSKAKMLVGVEVGPSSATRRMATVRSLLEMAKITTDPESLQVIQSMILSNIEGDNVGDIRNFFRMKLVRMGVVKPTPDEAKILQQEAQNKKPDAQEEYFLAAADKERAEANEHRADTIKTQADADHVRAKTIETLVDVDAKEQEQAMGIINAMRGDQNGDS